MRLALVVKSIVAVSTVALGAAPVAAQAKWPTQQIKFIIPNPPGGLPDILSRSIADPLRAKLGQPVIVENRPGANAGIGAAATTASKPDGYTYLVSDSAVYNISHHLNSQLPFARNDLMPVLRIARSLLFITAGPGTKIRTLQDLVKEAKANPGKVSYGSIGVGSFHHLTMEAVQAELGLKLNHIPYKGTGESVTALRAGQIDMIVAAFAGIAGAVKAQQAFLVAHNASGRTRIAPDVPSIGDTIKGFDLSHNQILWARAGTPIDIANKMAEAMREVLKEPQVVARFDTLGIEADVLGPIEMKAYLDAEAGRIKKVIDAAGLKPN
jgi:tripartite-type tricarboxylate transporter receptor subunit TctC